MIRYAFFFLATALFLGALARDRFDKWIETTALPVTLAETSTEVRDRDGVLLRVYTVGNGVWRLMPHLPDVDPTYLEMLIRYEDKRFWRHSGVDGLATLRAAAQAVRNGRPVSGASTLTMQVARLLEDGSTGQWRGKIRQIRLALALERRLDKSEILSLYLTHAPFGGSLEGLRAASLAWFGKEPRRLTPSQAALLVALPQSPETRRPDRQPVRARQARDRVLQRLQSEGLLTPEQRRMATSAALPDRMRAFPNLAAHLSDRLRSQFPERLRFDLTLSAQVQTKIETLVTDAARQAGSRVSAALVVADHHTGEIVASVGSPSYGLTDGRQGFVDMTRAIRSPGSTLKPLVYALAFDQGLAHPETLIHDGPVRFERYAPSNFDGVFRGDIRVRDALRLSLNIPVVKLTRELGPARLMAAIRRSGAETRLPGGTPGLAISLGGLGISLHDLVQLYAALARGGQAQSLQADRFDPSETGQRVVSEVAAWQIGDILSGLPHPSGAPDSALAYKTGTSYGHRDAWAIGFDGRHVIGVWMGRADGTPVPGAFGGELAAPVLFEAFGHLKPNLDPLPPPPPATLIVSGSDLPPPLRRFRARNATFAADPDSPELIFPPDGAVLGGSVRSVTLKLRGGLAPYLILANGRPVATGQRRTEFSIPAPGLGFSTLVVIDRWGRADRVTVQFE